MWFHACPSEAIKRKVELDWGTEDSEYLQKVELHSEGTLNEVRPDIIVYNAGTDVLDGDPLGGLSISPQVPFPATKYCKRKVDFLGNQSAIASRPLELRKTYI